LAADIFQFVSMYFIAAYMFFNTLIGLVLFFLFPRAHPMILMVIVGIASLVIMVLSMIINVAFKWLILGSLKEGDYPLWGSYHMKLWFVEAMNGVVMSTFSWLLSGTPILTWYLRAMGCSIGSNVVINGAVSGFDLVEIGDGCIINIGAAISASTIEDGMISFRHVKIGEGVTLGTRAMVQLGAVVGDHAIIDHMCSVAPYQVVGSDEKWVGSPAELDGIVAPPDDSVKVSPGGSIKPHSTVLYNVPFHHHD